MKCQKTVKNVRFDTQSKLCTYFIYYHRRQILTNDKAELGNVQIFHFESDLNG